jgi:hypothetical protein
MTAAPLLAIVIGVVAFALAVDLPALVGWLRRQWRGRAQPTACCSA